VEVPKICVALLMGDFPAYSPLVFHAGGVISYAEAGIGVQNLLGQSTAWPSANRALFVPVRVPYPVTVCKLAIGSGVTAAGNFDVGIYDSQGNKIVSSGATAKGTSTEQVIDITDTQIGPGLYYLALAADGTNNYILVTPAGTSPVPLQFTRLTGVVQMDTAYTLPATATFAAATTAVFPTIAAYLRPY
jgi:hypothetical protein